MTVQGSIDVPTRPVRRGAYSGQTVALERAYHARPGDVIQILHPFALVRGARLFEVRDLLIDERNGWAWSPPLEDDLTLIGGLAVLHDKLRAAGLEGSR